MLADRKRWLNLPALMAIIGLALGVASLVAAMGVISGYKRTLTNALIDVAGHVTVIHRSENVQALETTLSRIRQAAPQVASFTPFLQIEAIMAMRGRVTGVAVQGVDPQTVNQVIQIRSHVVQGQYKFGQDNGVPMAMVGKGIVKKLGLSVGQTFQVVHPIAKTGSGDFTSKIQKFVLVGVIDFGKIEFDERLIISDLATVQTFAEVGEKYSGLRLRLHDTEDSEMVAKVLTEKLGIDYYVSSWRDMNRNLLEAIDIEKVAIFLILMIMVLAASLNVSSNLFVNVLQRYSEIGILKAIGVSPRDVVKMFTLQGLFFGVVGSVLGVLLGLGLCSLFVWIQQYVLLMPVDVYKLDHIGVEIRFWDMFSIIFVSLVICLISSIAPALRGARLAPVEGLRYV